MNYWTKQKQVRQEAAMWQAVTPGYPYKLFQREVTKKKVATISYDCLHARFKRELNMAKR